MNLTIHGKKDLIRYKAYLLQSDKNDQ